jgi:hypothetical protein
VVNAVHDALAGHDRSALSMPLTPAAVWAALQDAPPAAGRGQQAADGPTGSSR